MNQQNAFNRIAELEAKLAIATENAAQAAKERDRALAKLADMRTYTLHDSNSALLDRLAAAEAVCELVDERLTPSFDPKMDDLIGKWMAIKDKANL